MIKEYREHAIPRHTGGSGTLPSAWQDPLSKLGALGEVHSYVQPCPYIVLVPVTCLSWTILPSLGALGMGQFTAVRKIIGVILTSALSSNTRMTVSQLNGKFGYYKVHYVPRVLRSLLMKSVTILTTYIFLQYLCRVVVDRSRYHHVNTCFHLLLA